MQERPGRFRTAKCSLSRSDIIISKCSFPFSAQIRASSLFLQALNSPSYLPHLRAIFFRANCYLWTFVCSEASLLTMQLIAIICYLAPVLMLGMGAVK